MSRSLKANLIKYGIATTLGGLLAYFYVSVRDFGAQPLMEQYRILCDAFTIPGLTFVMIGFLIMVANEGFFDMLSYAASKAVGIFLPGRGFSDNGEKYYDYVQRKRGNRTTGFGFLFVVGCVLMAFAFLFMFLFYRLYNA